MGNQFLKFCPYESQKLSVPKISPYMFITEKKLSKLSNAHNPLKIRYFSKSFLQSVAVYDRNNKDDRLRERLIYCFIISPNTVMLILPPQSTITTFLPFKRGLYFSVKIQ